MDEIMSYVVGFFLVLLAGTLQGTFVLPMTLTRRWQWEHIWASFALLGMLLFNWAITFSLIPNVWTAYKAVALQEILVLAMFGAGWGIGAILFGLSMKRLGMALGYPIIMGLIASLGALIPMAVQSPAGLLTVQGLLLIAGLALVVAGIIICSHAAVLRQRAAGALTQVSGHSLAAGLFSAIAAGVLSCLPNVGMNLAVPVIQAAEAAGVAPAFARNAVWAVFFSAGFVVNFAYCVLLMMCRGNVVEWFRAEPARNFMLATLMAVMWIGSFHLYGAGAAKLGQLGGIVGWPIFICLAIGIGNLWGIWLGEWRGAPSPARLLLNCGLLVLAAAVVIISISSM